MKSNYKQAAAQARLPREAMAKFMLRASVEDRVQNKINEYELKRKQELSAYAKAVDATMLYALHIKEGWGAKRLRRFWEELIKIRIKCREFYRGDDTGYEEQETGKNVEDVAINYELRNIGVDLDAWESENIIVDEKTGDVRFVVEAK